MKPLHERTTWTNPNIKYLKNVKIYEFDLKSAGLSIIKEKKLLSEKKIKQLEEMPKEKRTVVEGIQIRNNPQFKEIFEKTFADVRYAFLYYNNLTEDDILSIKRDAIFVINKKPSELVFGENFKFVQKHLYSSYIKLDNKEIFYSPDTDSLDIKGINTDVTYNECIWNDVKHILKMSEKISGEKIFPLLKNYRRKYLRRELDIEAYRNIVTGKFHIDENQYEYVNEGDLEDIDIEYNYINLILPLIQQIL